MGMRAAKIFQALGALLWAASLVPSIFAIATLHSVHPALADRFTVSDIFYLLREVLVTPGEYYAWLLSAMGLSGAASGWVAATLSAVLFAPFVIGFFLRAPRYRFLQSMIRLVGALFVAACVVATAWLYIGHAA